MNDIIKAVELLEGAVRKTISDIEKLQRRYKKFIKEIEKDNE